MALRVINIGGSPGDGTGDPLRTAMDKVKNNFAELFSIIATAVSANKIFASPDNASGVPTFRSLVLRDLPTTGATTNSVLSFDGSNIVWANIINLVYPIGSYYFNDSNATNPGTLFGVGTWVAVAGRMLVGIDGTQVEFDTINEQGGTKTHTLTLDEIPAHTHNIFGVSDPAAPFTGSAGANGRYPQATGTTTSAGGGAAHNNLPPYRVVYMWRRTA